ncbi:A, transposase OrfB [Burkholderia pseudomallei 1106b]|uniref:A, transposase OrfB n=1 Tax=Burkholderia pseudomallei (strain 1106a) TaxID=357348 RepID=A3NPV4_BURP0|nr:A, transposase OrfB [Burkholderia pseudomallei 1106a]EES26970.1 A, transposase OrfB [Burkholderia pseudomallei 1106b]
MLAIREKVNISERRACRLVGLSRSVLHYDAKPDHENEVLAALTCPGIFGPVET